MTRMLKETTDNIIYLSQLLLRRYGKRKKEKDFICLVIYLHSLHSVSDTLDGVQEEN